MTPKGQRIGIWIITVVMTVGIIGSFAVMILGTQNQEAADKQAAEQQAKQQKQLEAQQKQQAALSSKYYPTFSQYQSTPTQFDPTTVGKTVTSQDLVVGTGATLGSTTNYQAYYIGWNPDGKVFDSSFSGSSLKTPLDTAQLGGPSGLIKGWSQGVVGMKVGGIRELTIPAALAYGDQSPSADIPANTPLKFIIYVIKTD
ncbi:MAG TPA: FKBP-type peptidyl-prolyl cis-trans isomerase [Candidatus Saccharimonadaceae bacterium]|nr:FKBP-type peptidyl-prolyl cis-trans isomerase [Candidatus Saccharimonadaceae bacterium]